MRIGKLGRLVSLSSGADAVDEIVFHGVGEQRLPLIEKGGAERAADGALPDRRLDRRRSGGRRLAAAGTADAAVSRQFPAGGGRRKAA